MFIKKKIITWKIKKQKLDNLTPVDFGKIWIKKNPYTLPLKDY